ncbi:MAG TPA: peptidase domain-containing ABC transporter [Kofleriaceae bacterium]|nr:peptidase domain-containing ABC transporter [Kofleriaceae bacterium]
MDDEAKAPEAPLEPGEPGEPGAPPELSEAELFPSLARLAQQRRGKVPFVQQLEWTDCGAACMAMVLGHLGRDTTLDEAREIVGGGGRDGAAATSIVRAAEHYGLRARGISIDIEHMRFLPAGTILHWEFNHYVVFERMTRKGAELLDPARGRRIIPEKQLRESFTGVALVFETTDTFAQRKAGSGRWAWYFRQLGGQRHLLTRVLVMSLLLRVFALAVPLLTAVLVDRVIPRGDHGLLLVVMIGLGGMLVFQIVTALVRTHLLLQLRTNLDTRLTLGFVDYLSRLPFDFFQRRSTGDLLMRVNNNATIREVLTANTLSALIDGLFVLLYIGLILAVDPLLGVVTLALGALQLTVLLGARRRYRDLLVRALDAQARSQSYLVEMIAGMSTLKAAAAESRAVERWSNLYVDELNVSLDRGRTTAVVDAVLGALTSGSPLVILMLGALRVMDSGISLGTMLAVNAIAIGLLAPLASLVNSGLQLQLLASYMDRVEDVLNTSPEQSGQDAARVPRLTGRVTLQDVAFRYSERAPLVVRDVSVDIRPGSMVALVGKSGCGKSTLASLIAGLYRPIGGRILFDGHDLARLDLRALRRQIGVVFQQPYLFAGSIRTNIALTDPTLPLDRVIAAARAAAIHDDVDAMPMGYDTMIADGGSSLSGGQRQRLAIARALVHRPALLILDEATSSLDAETERAVMHSMAQLRCTRIVLAHRLSTIQGADLILVMDRGEIVESGTHAELLARGKVYSRLVAAQLSPDAAPGGA